MTDYISRYTRAQAIDDGVLVDMALFAYRGAPILEQLRFAYPVAMTCTAFGEVIGGGPEHITAARVAFLLGQLKRAILAYAFHGGDSRISFTCTNAEFKPVDLWAVCAPGDDSRPVITVMLRRED